MNALSMQAIDPIIKLLGSNGEWLAEINIISITLRLLLAVIFGGFIGVERATKRHAAGLRTYILVSFGATVVMLVNQYLYEVFETGDVARLGAQVISGIGFLGAGTILVTQRNRIRGLTTAAGLWACACMGLAIGVGFYTLAIVSFVIIIIVLTFLPKLENLFTAKSGVYQYHIEFDEKTNIKDFVQYVRATGLKINMIEPNPGFSGTGLYVCTIMLSVQKGTDKKYKDHNELLEEIVKLEYVQYAEEIL